MESILSPDYTNVRYLKIRFVKKYSLLRRRKPILLTKQILFCNSTGMEKPHSEITDAERAELNSLLSNRNLPAKIFKRAIALLELDRGRTMSEVARMLRIRYPTILLWRHKYHTRQLGCLYEAPRPGRPMEIDDEACAKITALICTPAREGHTRWKLELLAEKDVELKYCEHISSTNVATILKK